MLLKISQAAEILSIISSFTDNDITLDDIDIYHFDGKKLAASLGANKFRVELYRISIGNPAEPLVGKGQLTRQEWGVRVAHTGVGALDTLLTEGLYDNLANVRYVVDGISLNTDFTYGDMLHIDDSGLNFYALSFNLITFNN